MWPLPQEIPAPEVHLGLSGVGMWLGIMLLIWQPLVRFTNYLRKQG